MSAGNLFLVALALHLAAGAVALGRRQATDSISALAACLGSLFGITASIVTLLTPGPIQVLRLRWGVPGGEIAIGLDALSAAFLLIIFVISALGSVYGLAYWSRSEQPRTATRLRVFSSLMTLGLALVVTSENAMLFLVAWELMALSAFFLVATEEERGEVRRAAWVYLIATHAGTACLFAAFALLRLETGSFMLTVVAAPTMRISIVFLLSLIGFGLKAGIVPLHFWLPGAHANAPSHVSALMSGVMLKAGIYGILRITSLVEAPPMWWAFVLGGLAVLTALTGISLAFGQIDLKRALAYSSVENIGIICIGIAVALAGRSAGQPLWITLGLGGAIAHVWSHSAFKSLLFFAAGSVLHATHTRNMERMGGLLRRMPVTGTAFVIGALSACGLPLLNGFVSEWLIALGLFEGIRGETVTGWYFAFAAPGLALAGALALASFVRLTGVVLLGAPRSEDASLAHEAPGLIRFPLVALASVCVLIGVFPFVLARPLEAVAFSWSGVSSYSLTSFLVPPALAFGIVILLLAFATVIARALVPVTTRFAPTWDCGYARPTARMQYTSSSFGEWIAARLLPPALRPDRTATLPAGFFPAAGSFTSSSPDPFADRVYEPLARNWAARFDRVRWLPQGRLSLYLVCIFVTMVVAFAWTIVRSYLQ